MKKTTRDPEIEARKWGVVSKGVMVSSKIQGWKGSGTETCDGSSSNKAFNISGIQMSNPPG